VLALYAAVRMLPLTQFFLISLLRKQKRAVFYPAMLAGTMQLLDGFIGMYQHDLSKTAGPLILGSLSFLAIYFYVRLQKVELQPLTHWVLVIIFPIC
jgi:hypothetical protein